MILECLIDYIGVTPSYGTPESGLHLNQLPGVTLAQIEMLNNADQASWVDLWNSIQIRASKTFMTSFTNFMNKKYRLKKITEQYQTSRVVNPATTYPPASELRGIFMDCFIVKSVFHYIPIEKVTVNLLNAGNFTLQIFGVGADGSTLTELDSFVVTGANAGENVVFVNKTYTDYRRIFIAYDATSITSVSTPLNSIDLNPQLLIAGPYAVFNHIYINGRISSGGTFTTQGLDTYGISTILGLKCSYEVFICANRQDLALAWWYLLGAELMIDRQYSDRVNRYTTVDIKKAKDLEELFRKKFENELETFVNSVSLTTDWCIDCDAQITRIQRIP